MRPGVLWCVHSHSALREEFPSFMELPKQQQTALHDILQAVLLDEELLVVLEQVVRLETLQSGLGLLQ